MGATTEVEIIVRRLPLGRVWVLKRSVEGEPLGLVAEGGENIFAKKPFLWFYWLWNATYKGTGEISEVLEGGLAWKEGVGSGPNGNNWYLTEINNRPLSLFSKDNQVKDRQVDALMLFFFWLTLMIRMTFVLIQTKCCWERDLNPFATLDTSQIHKKRTQTSKRL
jgi:hypothetical protein